MTIVCQSLFEIKVAGTLKVLPFRCQSADGHSGRHFSKMHGYFIRWDDHQETGRAE